jgi:hypothetical protein
MQTRCEMKREEVQPIYAGLPDPNPDSLRIV